MNHEQWEALLAATHGHTPGPYRVHGWEPRGEDGEVWEYYLTSTNGHRINKTGNELAAAAPDLLAEVERLRGWLEGVRYFAHAMDHSRLQDICNSALNGAEVPE